MRPRPTQARFSLGAGRKDGQDWTAGRRYVFGSPVITFASCLVDVVRAARNHTISEYLRQAVVLPGTWKHGLTPMPDRVSD